MSDRRNDAPDGDVDDQDTELEDEVDDTDFDPNAESEESFEDDEPTVEAGDVELIGTEAESRSGVGGVPVTRPMRPSERRAMRASMEHGPLAVDPAFKITDRASAFFVLLTVGVFAIVMLNGLAFGHGGFLSPTPSPVPTPIVTPAPSATAGASGTPAPTVTAAPTESAAPTDTTAPSPSAAPTPTAAAS